MNDQLVGPHPLTEDDGLVARPLETLLQDGKELVRLVPEVRLLVEQIGAVAAHPHVLQGDHQPSLVGLGQKAEPAPLGHDARDNLGILHVVRHLLFCHGHEIVLVEPLRQLLEDLLLGPADQDRLKGPSDLVQVPVADHLAELVGVLMLRQESEHRPQAKAIHELHDRVEFLQPVLQGCPGQDDGILGMEPFDRLGPPGLPVLDPLGLIENDNLGTPLANRLQVPMHHLVVDDLVERLGGVQIGSAASATLRPPAPTGRRTSRSPAATDTSATWGRRSGRVRPPPSGPASRTRQSPGSSCRDPCHPRCRLRPARAAKRAPSRWYGYKGTLSRWANAALSIPLGNALSIRALRAARSRTSAMKSRASS